jgi:hypothetical protein
MPIDDFQQAVLSQLATLQSGQGALKTGQEDLSRQVGTIFKKIEGNGQPGISQRLAMLETRCTTVQQQKEKEAEEKDRAENITIQKKGLTWGAWVAIIAAILGGPILDRILTSLWK